MQKSNLRTLARRELTRIRDLTRFRKIREPKRELPSEEGLNGRVITSEETKKTQLNRRMKSPYARRCHYYTPYWQLPRYYLERHIFTVARETPVEEMISSTIRRPFSRSTTSNEFEFQNCTFTTISSSINMHSTSSRKEYSYEYTGGKKEKSASMRPSDGEPALSDYVPLESTPHMVIPTLQSFTVSGFSTESAHEIEYCTEVTDSPQILPATLKPVSSQTSTSYNIAPEEEVVAHAEPKINLGLVMVKVENSVVFTVTEEEGQVQHSPTVSITPTAQNVLTTTSQGMHTLEALEFEPTSPEKTEPPRSQIVTAQHSTAPHFEEPVEAGNAQHSFGSHIYSTHNPHSFGTGHSVGATHSSIFRRAKLRPEPHLSIFSSVKRRGIGLRVVQDAVNPPEE